MIIVNEVSLHSRFHSKRQLFSYSSHAGLITATVQLDPLLLLQVRHPKKESKLILLQRLSHSLKVLLSVAVVSRRSHPMKTFVHMLQLNWMKCLEGNRIARNRIQAILSELDEDESDCNTKCYMQADSNAFPTHKHRRTHSEQKHCDYMSLRYG